MLLSGLYRGSIRITENENYHNGLCRVWGREGGGTKYPRGSMYPIIRYLGFWVIVIIV